MVWRSLATASFSLYRSQKLQHIISKSFLTIPVFFSSINNTPSHCCIVCKVLGGGPILSHYHVMHECYTGCGLGMHSRRFYSAGHKAEEIKANIVADDCSSKVPEKKRKKLKGKRAVVKWLKQFRWKKKKEFDRLMPDEKILYKLRKAQKKEGRLLEALKKIEPKESSEATHDPEILTPEEHFYFLKMGKKSKNYVPVGRRGIYQGVILNMHLHWKKHQTLKVIVKTFTPEEVKDIAAELARLSGGIVLDIEDDETIIMYRGKNYSQPPTEIMSPRCTLPRKKALDKSKYRDALRAVRRYIPRLEQELQLIQAQAENKTKPCGENGSTITRAVDMQSSSSEVAEKASQRLKEILAKNADICSDEEDTDDPVNSVSVSDSEDLSDTFDTDSESEYEKVEQPLYLDKFDTFPDEKTGETEDFAEQMHRISSSARKEKSGGKGSDVAELDEIDRMILQAASLLKKRR